MQQPKSSHAEEFGLDFVRVVVREVEGLVLVDDLLVPACTSARMGAGLGGWGTANGRWNVNETVVPLMFRFWYERPTMPLSNAVSIAWSFSVIATSTVNWLGSAVRPT